MAKQRPQPKPKARSTPASSRPEPSSPAGDGRIASAASPQTPSQTPPVPPAPVRRSTYIEAVAIYERGLEAVQRHEYPEAIRLLESVLRLYPEEKELHERVRLYLNICRRQEVPREATPQTVQERLYASTIALNGGRYDEALEHLHLVRDEDPDNDHALYMLAVAHAQRGEHAVALAHLERAISLNPENRALARRDPDLEPLRDHDSFRSTLDTVGSSVPRADRRRPQRFKTAR
jgi:tetratricopeptide (TPR) repeat protein